jgi:predicted nuclease of predicted toxin-antitoxin system
LTFVADEDLDRQIVQRLREDGHVVWYVAEMVPGVSDQDVLNLANHEQAVLLTADKDFGELVYRQHLVNTGVVLLRLAGSPPAGKAQLVAWAVTAHMKEMAAASWSFLRGRFAYDNQGHEALGSAGIDQHQPQRGLASPLVLRSQLVELIVGTESG